MAVNNETGTLQDIAALSTAVKAKNSRCAVHVDAVQAWLRIPIDLKKWKNVDTLSVSGHKVHAPKGIGALFIRDSVRQTLCPPYLGGHQERGLRPGTENTPYIIGLGLAAAKGAKNLNARNAHIRTFKVEAKRADKTFPMKSPELCRELGAYLLGKHPHLRVNVHEPQLEIMVEIRDKGAYIHGPKVEAAGGLPVGTSGRALNLLSGGIDSPVAAYCMARRGLALHHIHFASPPYTSLRAKLKVRALARELAEYTGNCQLFVVPYTKPQEYIRDNAPDVLFTVLMRRSMLRIAKLVADQSEMEALITGESLAQVASQTMQAIACTDAAQNLPILRPLIGMDKTEIIAISRKIGTFDTSIEPYEDCCTIFTPPHPKTKPSLAEIEAAEAGMPGLAELERIAAETVEKIPIRIGDDPEF